MYHETRGKPSPYDGFMIAAALFSLALLAATQPAAETPLTREIAAQDAAMFAAFNAHDVPALITHFTEDLEFYHDKGGLSGYGSLSRDFTALFHNSPGIIRTLVPGSLHVYPVPNFGAMEIGEHRFCHDEHGKPDCGTFAFAMVWKQEKGGWKVSRVLSYGH